jgi:glycosyltransferase involved in cell wall biosynthesis
LLILHIAHSYPPDVSGIAEIAYQTSTRLAARGHEVHVFTGQIAGAQSAEVVDGVHINRFDLSGNEALGIRGNPEPFLREVSSRQWDVIAMHCLQTWNTDLLLSRLPDIPGRKVLIGQGRLTPKDPRYRAYYKALESYGEAIDALITPSPDLDEAKFASAHQLCELELIPNGVDPSQFEGPTTGTRSRWNKVGSPWLLTISNHNPNKGHFRLWPVVRGVRDRFPTAVASLIGNNYPAAKYRLGVIGVKGGCWYACRLRQRTHSGVDLRHGIPRPDVISALKEADVILIPSTWEASPLVAVEAMGAGTPWVAFDVGAIRDLKGGFVVRTVEEMIARTTDLLASPDLRAQLGTAGKHEIKAKYEWEKVVDGYEALYRRLLATRSVIEP